MSSAWRLMIFLTWYQSWVRLMDSLKEFSTNHSWVRPDGPWIFYKHEFSTCFRSWVSPEYSWFSVHGPMSDLSEFGNACCCERMQWSACRHFLLINDHGCWYMKSQHMVMIPKLWSTFDFMTIYDYELRLFNGFLFRVMHCLKEEWRVENAVQAGYSRILR